MVFKNGELLRSYYLVVNLAALPDDTYTFHFSDFRDENGNTPDVSVANQGGGELYEFIAMDFEYTTTDFNRDLQFYKVNMFGDVHELLILVNSNAQYVHYDNHQDFRSVINTRNPHNTPRPRRTLPVGAQPNVNTNPEDWRFYIAESGAGDDFTGEVRITMVVRVH